MSLKRKNAMSIKDIYKISDVKRKIKKYDIKKAIKEEKKALEELSKAFEQYKQKKGKKELKKAFNKYINQTGGFSKLYKKCKRCKN